MRVCDHDELWLSYVALSALAACVAEIVFTGSRAVRRHDTARGPGGPCSVADRSAGGHVVHVVSPAPLQKRRRRMDARQPEVRSGPGSCVGYRTASWKRSQARRMRRLC
jgi:hypothetical protein